MKNSKSSSNTSSSTSDSEASVAPSTNSSTETVSTGVSESTETPSVVNAVLDSETPVKTVQGKPGFQKVTVKDMPASATPEVKTIAPREEVEEPKSEVKEKKSKKTEIWASLKDRKISIFSLPAQPVSYYLAFISEAPGCLICSHAIPALASALENAYKDEFEFTTFDKNKLEIKPIK